ncbi:multicopper oxidase domain-containing protein [Flavobacterium collinsii]|uniref:multicopper oxidase domain-containing protein n=1 Tax=Flavobacterium collinsii TaxID=1114861 RepID=UPI001FE88B60|nr:multicopper oxidase domain-containing protein [Flavobacterium collinsii]
MKGCPKSILTFCFLLSTIFLFSQNEYLVIGRTTGKLFLKNNVPIRTFGFTNSLSGQVTLPGLSIEAVEGENVSIDFWNISQGNPVSLFCKEIDFVQRDKENVVLKKEEAIHHMEHGYYSFQAQKAGTYLYYSPENYPFNLQAGMFGVIIIRAKDPDSVALQPLNEILWCSNELDTKWHTDAIMGTEYDSSNKPIVLPKYKPEYFLINGKIATENKGLQALDHKNETVLLRLVNSGVYLHEIVFPSQVKLQLRYGNESSVTTLPDGCKIQLHSGESIEVLAFLENVGEKEHIVYHFNDPVLKKKVYEAAIPVFY